MRVVIQRVSEAKVIVDNLVVGEINHGLVVLQGIEHDDTNEDVEWLAQKIASMRIFSDEEGKMNRDVREVNGNILLISQFTLHASTKKGNRPSFINAAKPESAILLYEALGKRLTEYIGSRIQFGKFGAMMQVLLINDGPVTILMDSKNKE